MDSDYRLRHNRQSHSEYQRQHKHVKWQKLDAPVNPFAAAASSCPPAKIQRIDEIPSNNIDTSASLSTNESTSIPDFPESSESSIEQMNTQEDTVNAETFVSVNDESNQIQNDEEKEAYTESHHANDVRNDYLEITHDTLQCQQSSQQAVHEIWELSQPRDKASFIDRGEGSRRFQIKWFDHDDWKTWLHYDREKDAAFCFTCVKAIRKNLFVNKNAEAAFVSTGYKNWGDAGTKGRGFDRHSQSQFHREAHERLYVIPNQCPDVGEMLNETLSDEKSSNRQALLKILSNVRFLARQALPLRGRGDGKNSNFTQLYLLREEDSPILKKWRTENKTDKYTHNTIQNEMMKIMALQVLREIAKNLQDTDFYTMMCDEATDVANTSQLVICLRWVDDNLVAHDEYIGLKDMADTSADSIVKALKDVLLRMNLNLRKCRGQCYDGCSTMTGHRNGVVTKIKECEKRALYSHCYCHSLNLAVGDTMKSSKILKDTIDTTFELTKLIKKSPKRESKLKIINGEIAHSSENDDSDDSESTDKWIKPAITLFCPTRWTVRGKCLRSVIENYDELQQLWDWSLDNLSDTEMKARIRGVSAHTRQFSYCFGIHLAETLLRITDNLSQTLQSTQHTAIDAQKNARDSVSTLQSIRSDEHFQMFYSKVKSFAEAHDASSPTLPRKRNPSQRKIDSFYATSNATAHHPATPEDEYRKQYFESIDMIVECIKTRFDQDDYEKYACSEQLLLKALRRENYADELKSIVDFYGDDFDRDILDTQLKTLPFVLSSAENIRTFYDVRAGVQTLSDASKAYISQVIKLLKLLIVMPATNAVSERSFSAMRRLYTYYRTNMGQNRLNHAMVLHVHKEKTDALSMVNVANEFVEGSIHRNDIFGKFTEIDRRAKTVPVRSIGVNVNTM